MKASIGRRKYLSQSSGETPKTIEDERENMEEYGDDSDSDTQETGHRGHLRE